MSPRASSLLSLLLALLLGACAAAPVSANPRPAFVLAAASLQESLTAAALAWQRRGHPRPVISFAASSALARQVEAGAPADLLITADEDWMNYLDQRAMLRAGSRARLLTNQLVLIAPAASEVALAPGPSFPLAAALGQRRLAMADPDNVPAGKYGREALTRFGVWRQVQGRIARAENVRAALALVARGEAPLGIVFATDARATRAVRVVGTFPASSHRTISYPVAALRRSRSPEGEAFRRFLVSPEATAIFRRYGFGTR